jgi:ATP-independent RNA helicase DbpA
MSTPFSNFPLPPDIHEVLKELSFREATPIQDKAIPALLAGRDLLAKSGTGSGKTLAFLLPFFAKVDCERRLPQGLVLCPTRELAMQVGKEAKKLGRKWPKFSVANLVGGQPIGPQLDFLRHGSQLVVGTPGRVLDHLKRKSLRLDRLAFFVLDEADRMLEMGFAEDVENILHLAGNCQKAFFSATYPEELGGILTLLERPEKIEIEMAKSPIRHQMVKVTEAGKGEVLVNLLYDRQPEQAIVFCHLKETVKELTEYLLENGIAAAGIQGDLEQRDRDEVMIQFRNQSIRILVATDVAARGIDIVGLDLVVNFDFPKPDIYVHRAGRSGRAGKSGQAISFVTDRDEYKLKDLDLKLEEISAPEGLVEGELAAPMATLCIFAGRKEKMRPGDILGALTGEGGFAGSDIGKIDILDRVSFVAIRSDLSELALKGILAGKIKGKKVRAILL